jgi:hypothetical protein
MVGGQKQLCLMHRADMSYVRSVGRVLVKHVAKQCGIAKVILDNEQFSDVVHY